MQRVENGSVGVFCCHFRDEKWIPAFLNRGSGVSESWGGLVFHMALLNGEDLALAKWLLKSRFHASFTLFNRAVNQCGQDKHNPFGFLHANMGSSGAEVPSTPAAAHGGMCGRFHRRATGGQPGLPHRRQ